MMKVQSRTLFADDLYTQCTEPCLSCLYSLGSRHDGEAENSACPARQNYVMSPGNSGASDVRVNFFSFSQCTIKEFIKYIRYWGRGRMFENRTGDLRCFLSQFQY